MNIREIFFWLHLGAGSLAGSVILVMCGTRAALGFGLWMRFDTRGRPAVFSAEAWPAQLRSAESFWHAPASRWPFGVFSFFGPGPGLLTPNSSEIGKICQRDRSARTASAARRPLTMAPWMEALSR